MLLLPVLGAAGSPGSPEHRNGVHWVLDVAFDEDRARNHKDHGVENLAIILAPDMLKRAQGLIFPSAGREKRSGWSDNFTRSVLGQMR
jgi:hypothetical protein